MVGNVHWTESRAAQRNCCHVCTHSLILLELRKYRFGDFYPPGVTEPGKTRARNWIQEHRLQAAYPAARPGDRPVSILCLLSGQLPAKPVTSGRRVVMCLTAAAAPRVGTGAPAAAFPPRHPPTPKPAPSIWGMPLVLPRLITDLRLIQMLSCWMNQLHVKERYAVQCEHDFRLVGLTSLWGSGGDAAPRVLGVLRCHPVSAFLCCFHSLVIFPGALFNAPGPHLLPSLPHSFRGLCTRCHWWV